MAIVIWPADKRFCPATMTIGLKGSVRLAASEETGDVQTAEVPGSKWMISATWPGRGADAQGAIEAIFAKIRGKVNRVALFHWGRQRPLNFSTGSITTTGNFAQGDTTLLLYAPTGQTFRPGEMIGILGQLFMIVDATGSGNLTVTVSPNLRAAVPSGTNIDYIRPTANFILTSDSVDLSIGPGGRGESFSASFMEVFP